MKKISIGRFIALYFFVYFVSAFLFGTLFDLLLSRFIGPFSELNNADNNFHWVGVLFAVIASLAASFIIRKRYALPSSLIKISSIVMFIFFVLNILYVLVVGAITSKDFFTIALNVLISGLWAYIPLFIADRFYTRNTK